MGRRVLDRRRGLAGWIIGALLASTLFFQSTVSPNVEPAAASGLSGTCASNHGVTVERVHGSTSYFDKKPSGVSNDFVGMYLGYRVTTASSAVTVSVQVSNGSRDAVANLLETSKGLGSIAAGSSKTAFFLYEAYVPNNKTQPSTPSTITVTVQFPGGTCNASDTISSSDATLAANPNKIYSGAVAVATSSPVGPGSRIYVKLTGNTGTIGSGPKGNREINLAPVTLLGNFDEAAWSLTAVRFQSKNTLCGVNGVVSDRLYFDINTSPSSLNCGGLYSLVYEFTAKSSGTYAAVASKIDAFAYIASGNLIKHTTPFAGDISIPRVAANAAVYTESESIDTVAASTLNSATPEFTANDAFAVTPAATTVTFSPLTFIGQVADIDWANTCLIDPSNSANCSNGPYTVQEYLPLDEATNGEAGSFKLTSTSDGKRLVFTPKTGPNFTSDPLGETSIQFRVKDLSNPAKTTIASAFVTVTTSFIAYSVDMSTPQGTQTESPILQTSNAQSGISSSCFVGPAGCVTSLAVSGQGTWSLGGSAASPTIIFSPASGYTGNASIDFKVTDGGNRTSQATVTVNVYSVPTVQSVNLTVPQGGKASVSPTVAGGTAPYHYCISETVPIAASCNASQVSTSNAVWQFNGGAVSVSPAANFTGTETVYIAVVDARSQVASNSATITITPPSAPTIQNDSATTNTAIRVTLSPAITASTSYTLYLISNSASVSSTTTAAGSWLISGGQVSFLSYNNFTGSATIDVQVVDAIGQDDTATMTVTVNAPAGPTVTGPSASTTTTSPVTLNPVGSSTLPLTYCLESQTNAGVCGNSTENQSGVGGWSRTSNQVTFTAVAGFTGSATISIIVTDTLGQTGSATLTVTVNDASFGAQAVIDALTHAASSITNTTATLNGSGYAPGAASATFWFCYDTTSNVATCNPVAATPASATAGNSASISYAVTGLTAGTTYYFKAMANSANSTVSGVILNFTTTGVAPTTPAPTPTPTAAPGPAIPAEPKKCTPKTDTLDAELGLVGVITRLFTSAATFASQTFGFLLEPVMNSSVGSALLSAQPALANPLLGSNTMVEVGQTTVTQMFKAAAPVKSTPTLDANTIELSTGTTSGELLLTSKTGEELSLLDAQFTDFTATTEFSGSDFNNPLTWQKLGYGAMCWKLEPFSDADYFFTLPYPLQLPAGAAAGEWEYSNVIVKAGSLTARSEDYQTDTVFAAPSPGQRVFADINANGIFDPGGKTGDKAISHIVICAKLKTAPAPTTQATASPTVSPTPTATATPTPTPTPTSTATPTPTGTATPTPSPTATVTPSASPTATPTQTPTPTATPTPTPTVTPTLKPEPLQGEDCVWPEPTTTPKIAEPTPIPTASKLPIVIKLLQLTPTPTPTPTGTATPTPSPTGTATPTPSPTGTATPTPSPTGTATPTPSPTATVTPTPSPTGTANPVPPISSDNSLPCTPNETYGAALLVSNGTATTCLRTTSLALFNIAFAPFAVEDETEFESDSSESDVVIAMPDVLADTGFDNGLLALLAMLMAGFGYLAIRVSRRRD